MYATRQAFALPPAGRGGAGVCFHIASVRAPVHLPRLSSANARCRCLTSADPQDLAAALTFPLRYQGRKPPSTTPTSSWRRSWAKPPYRASGTGRRRRPKATGGVLAQDNAIVIYSTNVVLLVEDTCVILSRSFSIFLAIINRPRVHPGMARSIRGHPGIGHCVSRYGVLARDFSIIRLLRRSINFRSPGCRIPRAPR